MSIPKVSIWSDGGCWPNPGPGGWGAVIVKEGVRSEIRGRVEEVTTNNRMELTAAIEAMKSLGEPCEVHIYTDSQYLQNGAREWLAKWQRRAWRTGRKPVLNQDLWREILRLKAYHKTHWHWVRGHGDCAENCRADALAARTTEPAAPQSFVGAVGFGEQSQVSKAFVPESLSALRKV